MNLSRLVLLCAYLVFENKGFALASVFGGPLCVAYFLARNSWR